MSEKMLTDICWFTDKDAFQRGEPGIAHSYMKCLATVLNYLDGDLDPAWLMGASTFAFRLMVNESLCPSAMSIFDWSLLPDVVEQSGRRCTYISRLWHEKDKEEERRNQAHAAITDGINHGAPVIVWDIDESEWGLIIGYDSQRKYYQTLTNQGKPSTLEFDSLGRNGIDILSVVIPGDRNHRTREEIKRISLEVAVRHADQQEWMDRPQYQDGLPAFDLWALICERGAQLAAAGKIKNVAEHVPWAAAYYADHYFGARCYARDYLTSIAEGKQHLVEAATCYASVAEHLRPVWEFFRQKNLDDSAALRNSAQHIQSAKAAEEQGIAAIRQYLQ